MNNKEDEMVRKDIVDTKNNRLQNVLDERRLNMASAARKAKERGRINFSK